MSGIKDKREVVGNHQLLLVKIQIYHDLSKLVLQSCEHYLSDKVPDFSSIKLRKVLGNIFIYDIVND